MNKPKEIKNAKITSTMLGTEDHGIFTASLNIEGDGWGCGFGGYGLDAWDEASQDRVGHPYGIDFIKGVLDTLGVDRWENLPGTSLRVELGGGWGSGVDRIGHLIKEVWFDPKAQAELTKARMENP